MKSAAVVRQDRSYRQLQTYSQMPYSVKQLKWRYRSPGLEMCPQCMHLDGQVFDVGYLLLPQFMDGPIFRQSHPNCYCELLPLDQRGRPSRLFPIRALKEDQLTKTAGSGYMLQLQDAFYAADPTLTGMNCYQLSRDLLRKHKNLGTMNIKVLVREELLRLRPHTKEAALMQKVASDTVKDFKNKALRLVRQLFNLFNRAAANDEISRILKEDRYAQAVNDTIMSLSRDIQYLPNDLAEISGAAAAQATSQLQQAATLTTIKQRLVRAANKLAEVGAEEGAELIDRFLVQNANLAAALHPAHPLLVRCAEIKEQCLVGENPVLGQVAIPLSATVFYHDRDGKAHEASAEGLKDFPAGQSLKVWGSNKRMWITGYGWGCSAEADAADDTHIDQDGYVRYGNSDRCLVRFAKDDDYVKTNIHFPQSPGHPECALLPLGDESIAEEDQIFIDPVDEQKYRLVIDKEGQPTFKKAAYVTSLATGSEASLISDDLVCPDCGSCVDESPVEFYTCRGCTQQWKGFQKTAHKSYWTIRDGKLVESDDFVYQAHRGEDGSLTTNPKDTHIENSVNLQRPEELELYGVQIPQGESVKPKTKRALSSRTMTKEADYGPPSELTRYCPDHPGVMVMPVPGTSEARQCPVDGKIYEQTAGIENQTPDLGWHLPSFSFTDRK